MVGSKGNVINLIDWKDKKTSTREDDDLSSRMQRIRTSLEKINSIMGELNSERDSK